MLHDFAKADADWLDDVLRGISDGAPDLAKGEPGRFMNAVALRTAPARSSKSPSPEPANKAAKPEEIAPDPRNPLQRLMDRFR